jgi:hypothetical protein
MKTLQPMIGLTDSERKGRAHVLDDVLAYEHAL